jgi:hypothetical protein
LLLVAALSTGSTSTAVHSALSVDCVCSDQLLCLVVKQLRFFCDLPSLAIGGARVSLLEGKKNWNWNCA